MQASSSKDPRREVRQRSRLACDACARSRVKCHGNQPCRRCQENNIECLYVRDLRKRGRKRIERLPQNDAANSTSPTVTSPTFFVQQEEPELATVDPSASCDHAPLSDMQQGSPGESATQGPGGSASCWPAVASAQDCVHPHQPSALPTLFEEFHTHHEINTVPQARTRQAPEHTEQPPSFHSPHIIADQYACLAPLLPHLRGILRPQLACELLELYFVSSQGSPFHNASPYVVTPVLRKESILDPACGRPTTIALLATMIWVSAQTVALPQLLSPGSREDLCGKLRHLVMQLQHERDPDNWHRVGGRPVSNSWAGYPDASDETQRSLPTPVVDDVLSLILITIVISGGDFKRECLPWWDKTLRLMEAMRLHQLDHPDMKWDNDAISGLSSNDDTYRQLRPIEAKEEMRRTFWLAYALDRHLALSFNANLHIVDGEHFVFSPLPEKFWIAIEKVEPHRLPARERGPSRLVNDTGFYEFFLPLMALLGDIIHIRRLRNHPHFGNVDHRESIAIIENFLDRCKDSVEDMKSQDVSDPVSHPNSVASPFDTGVPLSYQGLTPGRSPNTETIRQIQPRSHSTQDSYNVLATSYAQFILHVLHVLLHGEWDALSMLAWLPPTGPHSNWISTPSFLKCSSNAVFASEAVGRILDVDPELSFMPYLIGIYLFQGSLPLLLFADRMPAVHGGPNGAVESACETIIRAHEACIVTLNTEFQRVFKRVMRATLMIVRKQNERERRRGERRYTGTDSGLFHGESVEEVRETVADMRKDMLKLYRWSCGGRGLAI